MTNNFNVGAHFPLIAVKGCDRESQSQNKIPAQFLDQFFHIQSAVVKILSVRTCWSGNFGVGIDVLPGERSYLAHQGGKNLPSPPLAP